METVCENDGSNLCYPAVAQGATEWAWSNEKPKDEIVKVSAHGLRRLLRAASQSYAFVASSIGSPDISELYKDRVTPEKARALLGELSTIWCEGELVMSRLFVTENGELVAHKDAEVDDAGTAPWDRT